MTGFQKCDMKWSKPILVIHPFNLLSMSGKTCSRSDIFTCRRGHALNMVRFRLTSQQGCKLCVAQGSIGISPLALVHRGMHRTLVHIFSYFIISHYIAIEDHLCGMEDFMTGNGTCLLPAISRIWYLSSITHDTTVSQLYHYFYLMYAGTDRASRIPEKIGENGRQTCIAHSIWEES